MVERPQEGMWISWLKFPTMHAVATLPVDTGNVQLPPDCSQHDSGLAERREATVVSNTSATRITIAPVGATLGRRVGANVGAPIGPA